MADREIDQCPGSETTATAVASGIEKLSLEEEVAKGVAKAAAASNFGMMDFTVEAVRDGSCIAMKKVLSELGCMLVPFSTVYWSEVSFRPILPKISERKLSISRTERRFDSQRFGYRYSFSLKVTAEESDFGYAMNVGSDQVARCAAAIFRHPTLDVCTVPMLSETKVIAGRTTQPMCGEIDITIQFSWEMFPEASRVIPELCIAVAALPENNNSAAHRLRLCMLKRGYYCTCSTAIQQAIDDRYGLLGSITPDFATAVRHGTGFDETAYASAHAQTMGLYAVFDQALAHFGQEKFTDGSIIVGCQSPPVPRVFFFYDTKNLCHTSSLQQLLVTDTNQNLMQTIAAQVRGLSYGQQ